MHKGNNYGIKIAMLLEKLRKLWNEFEDVPINQDECIDEPFHIWDIVRTGTKSGIGLMTGYLMGLQ